MLVVVASCHDKSATDLVAHWSAQGARLLSCEDLSRPGWRFYRGRPEHTLAVISGAPTPSDAIKGILIRRPCIFEEEVLCVRTDDRHYAAQEMNAFLIAWLSSLSCPILNTPSELNLLGPNWRREQWVHRAAGIGIAVRPTHRNVPEVADNQRWGFAAAELTNVTVVGDRCFGAASETIGAQAVKLAKIARVGLLGLTFLNADGTFVSANLKPDLSDPVVSAAVCEYLTGTYDMPELTRGSDS